MDWASRDRLRGRIVAQEQSAQQWADKAKNLRKRAEIAEAMAEARWQQARQTRLEEIAAIAQS